ncbi:large ribosomal subunit protein uL29m [Palaemon carinicauda]|uniref:large ribosomal subunit protein uL29m n=1 Tax=Palaemon carinicauda TaxID=392227 RepID=UPI0035B63B9C
MACLAALRKSSLDILTGLAKFESLSITRGLIRPAFHSVTAGNPFRNTFVQRAACIHTSVNLRSLSEFFDDKKNWGEFEVKVGRSWRLEELRIKSNEDLHKLWYVLLKEKNMLLTMEHACKVEYRIFPNPERIDKVEESMSNLETVVRERNRAYWLLETGETGERPCGRVVDPLGRESIMQYAEYFIPKFMNNAANKKMPHRGSAVHRFRKLMREKAYLEKKKYYNRIRNHVCHLLRRFPHMNEEAVEKQFPEVNVATLRRLKRSLGNHQYNEA